MKRLYKKLSQLQKTFFWLFFAGLFVFGYTQIDMSQVKGLLTALGAKQDTTAVVQTPDYIISKVGSTITATPRQGSGLLKYSGTDAYTVIQATIDALTPSGTIGTGGGKIVLDTMFTLSNELVITGWEHTLYPTSQLTIEGEGWKTGLIQNTTGKNGLVIKNNASVNLRNFKITVGASGYSAILLDNSGTNYEISVNKGSWDNLSLLSQNPSYPCLWMKNFFSIDAGLIVASNSAGDAILMDNVSSTINYGNSSFKLLKAVAKSTSGIGLHMRSSTTAIPLDLININHYECIDGYRGIFIESANHIDFDYVDLEEVKYPISVGYDLSDNPYVDRAENIVIRGGLAVATTGGTGIRCGGNGGGNYVFGPGLFVDNDATGVPILDIDPGVANHYDVELGYNSNPANINVSAANTFLTYTFGGVTTNKLPSVTLPSATATTIASFDASKNLVSLATASYPSLAELAYVKGATSNIQTQLNSKVSGTSGKYTPTLTGVQNISSVTVSSATYSQNGNIVHIGLNVTVNVVDGTNQPIFYFSLPPGLSTTSTTGNGIGTGTSVGGKTAIGYITTGTTASIQCFSPVSDTYYVQFSYSLN